MRQYLYDWWVELTSVSTYRRWLEARPYTCAASLFAVLSAVFVSGTLLFTSSCATPGVQVEKLNHLLRAAEALHELAEQAAELEGEQRAEEVLLEQLPFALDRLGEALSELCAKGGPLPPDHKVCRHYQAYVDDPS